MTTTEKEKVSEFDKKLYKTFLILAMVSFTLGALVNLYTLKRIYK
jgi:uncharacterized membrane protein